jgi:hypothetical protein
VGECIQKLTLAMKRVFDFKISIAAMGVLLIGGLSGCLEMTQVKEREANGLASTISAPSLQFESSEAFILVRGEAFDSIYPVNEGGKADTCTVLPELPMGLQLDRESCALKGKPWEVAVLKTYTLTAKNESGENNTEFDLAVHDQAPHQPFYSVGTLECVVGKFCGVGASYLGHGGVPIAYELTLGNEADPLPAGLSFNTSTGVITGEPTVATDARSFEIRAESFGGAKSSPFALIVRVFPDSGGRDGDHPIIIYQFPEVICEIGKTCSQIPPMNLGGVVDSWSEMSTPAQVSGFVFIGDGSFSGEIDSSVAPGDYVFTARASNVDGSREASFVLKIVDPAPSGLVYGDSPVSCVKDSACSVSAPSVTGDDLSFSVSPELPAGLSIHASTGVISGTPTAISSQNVYIVRAQNSGGSIDAGILLQVVDAAPVLSLAVAPSAYTRDAAITALGFDNTGGGVTSCASVPSLPQGLSLNVVSGSCEISGTPSEIQASKDYVITGSNTGGSGSASVSLIVHDIAPETPVYTTASFECVEGLYCGLPDPALGSAGVPLSYTLTALGDPLPAGLSFNTQTGAIAGTVSSVVAARSFQIQAQSFGGATSASFTLSVEILAAQSSDHPIILYNPASLICEIGGSCEKEAPLNLGGAVDTWSEVSAAGQVTGFVFNGADGTFSGTIGGAVSLGDYTFTVKAENPAGDREASFVLKIVDPAPSGLVYGDSPVSCVKDSACSVSAPSVTGDDLSFSVSPELPAGLSIHASTGVISGTPTAIASQNVYIVRAQNSGGSTEAGVLLRVVDEAPSFSNPALQEYTRDFPITLLSISRTNGLVVSCVSVPSLPHGLVLTAANNTCEISGTPIIAQVAKTYLITGSNAGGSDTAAVEIRVDDIAPSVPTYTPSALQCVENRYCGLSSPVKGSAGVPIEYELTLLNGEEPLASGLNFNADTGTISGVPALETALRSFEIRAKSLGGAESDPFVLTVEVLADEGSGAPAHPIIFYNPLTITCETGAACAAPAPINAGGLVDSWSDQTVGTPVTGFDFNSADGTFAAASIPPDSDGEYIYTVRATNAEGSRDASFTLKVIDPAPTGLSYANSPISCAKDVDCLSHSPSVTGGSENLEYSVSPALPTGLSLNASSGVISGTPSLLTSQNIYTVKAQNSGGSVSAALLLQVLDAAPMGLSYSESPVTCQKDVACSVAAPAVVGEGLSFSVSPSLPAGLTFDTGDGSISGTPSVLSSQGVYIVRAQNSGGSTDSALILKVIDPAPTGLAYSESPVTCTKDAACSVSAPSVVGNDLVFSITPSLPSGLSFGANGSISGTPTVVSSQNSYLVSAQNSGGSMSTSLLLRVTDEAPDIALAAVPLDFTKDVAIAAIVFDNDGGDATECSSSIPLPYGLSLSVVSGSCQISGTPLEVQAEKTYTITAQNSGGSSDASVDITVNDIAPVVPAYTTAALECVEGLYCALPAPAKGSAGVPVEYELTLVNGAEPLPTGLSFSTDTGQISGVPASVTTLRSFTIKAKSLGGATSDPFALTIEVLAPAASDHPIIFYNPVEITCETGAACAAPAPMNAGGAIVSWSDETGSAPVTGFDFNSADGTFAATSIPAGLAGEYTYTVRATNANGSRDASFLLNIVDPAPSGLVYNDSPVSCTIGEACAVSAPSVTGSNLAFTISPALPGTLSLNASTGAISGTPNALSSQNVYTVRASNSGGFSEASLLLQIDNVPPVLALDSSPSAFTKGMVITPVGFNNTGGDASNCTVSPALPYGLSLVLDGGSCEIQGTPLQAKTEMTYTVTALNSGGSSSDSVQIQVNDLVPTQPVYTVATLQCTIGSLCGLQAPTHTAGGGEAIEYVLDAGTLPSGMSLNQSTGMILGTPDVVGTSSGLSIVARALGSADSSASNLTSIEVSGAPSVQPMVFYSPSERTCMSGSACEVLAPSNLGGAIASWSELSAEDQLTGFAFDDSTGVFSSVNVDPLEAGNEYTFTVRATNPSGSSEASFVLKIIDPAPTGLSYVSSPITCTNNQACGSHSPTVSGGTNALTYSVNPALPAGLSVDASTGVISGTHAGISPQNVYSVRASNTGGSVETAVLLEVRDVAPVLSVISPSAYTSGTAISNLDFGNSGGNVLSCSAAPFLPEGLTLTVNAGSCRISGTPSEPQIQKSYSITGTNSGGSSSASVNITINDIAPSAPLYSAAKLECTENLFCGIIPPTHDLQAGGKPIEWEMTGTLPQGMQFDPQSGMLFGTPSATGVFESLSIVAKSLGGATSASADLVEVEVVAQGAVGGDGNFVQLVFTSPPSANYVGIRMSPGVVVEIRNMNGDLITTGPDSTAPVSISGPGIDGTTTVTAANGIATFFHLVPQSAGTKTLLAFKSGVAGGTGVALNVSESFEVFDKVWDFTTCEKTGRFGPDQLDCNSAYAGTSLKEAVTVVGGIQRWTVPASGTYRIEAQGAGGSGNNAGARMRGDFELKQNDVLQILVGQRGTHAGAGNGGSFVALLNNTPLIVAGGAGGVASSFSTNSLEHGVVGTCGASSSYSGGCNGSGGGGDDNWSSVIGGGGGFSGNGTTSNSTGGFAFLNGGLGGFYSGGRQGGFGGGGATSTSINRSGGGGGYSGGAGSSSSSVGGGGGGSYNAGTNPDNASGVNPHKGLVRIEKIKTQDPLVPELVFTLQPKDFLFSGQTLDPVVVEIRDLTGDLITTGPDATAEVTLSLIGDGTLLGTLTMAASGGVAEFTDLTVDYPWFNYQDERQFTLLATKENKFPDGGLGPLQAESQPFTVGGFTFSTCGVTGRLGPLQEDCDSESQAIVNVEDGIQEWTVPVSGTYRIEAQGAGGSVDNAGARMRGDFELQQNDVLKILVGQRGTHPGAGNGGSFVALLNNTPLIVAGGAGGVASSFSSNSREHGVVGSCGVDSSYVGGCSEDGGGGTTTAGGGGGFSGNGTTSGTRWIRFFKRRFGRILFGRATRWLWWWRGNVYEYTSQRRRRRLFWWGSEHE